TGTCEGAGILYGLAVNMDVAVYSIASDTAAFYVNGSAGHTLLGAWPTPATVYGMRIGDVLYFPAGDAGGSGVSGVVGYPLAVDGDTLSNFDQPRGLFNVPDFEWAGGQLAPLGNGYYLGKDGVVLLEPPLEGVPLSEIVRDMSLDCGLTEGDIDVSELTDI